MNQYNLLAYFCVLVRVVYSMVIKFASKAKSNSLFGLDLLSFVGRSNVPDGELVACTHILLRHKNVAHVGLDMHKAVDVVCMCHGFHHLKPTNESVIEYFMIYLKPCLEKNLFIKI